MKNLIYLDNSATTKVHPEVADVLVKFSRDSFGNPSSIHKLGREARRAVEAAREQVALLLNCQPDEIYFTPCATYSNNIAILGRAQYIEQNGGKKHLVTTSIEHPSSLGPAKYLEGQGWKVTYLPVDKTGLVPMDAFKRAVTPETGIVSIIWANNEIGTVQPVEEMCEHARKQGAHFHTDAVQMPGRLPIDLSKVVADTLALSGHKFYAPKGVGVLYLRRGTKLCPLIMGGGQEHGLFPGTEGLANIAAIGKAAEIAHAQLSELSPRLLRLQQVIKTALSAYEGIIFTGSGEQRLPGHVSAILPGIESETLVMQADMKGIFVSSASACKKGITQPSHVISALGFNDEKALGALRISAGYYNTEEECESAAKTIVELAMRLRTQEKLSNVR